MRRKVRPALVAGLLFLTGSPVPPFSFVSAWAQKGEQEPQIEARSAPGPPRTLPALRIHPAKLSPFHPSRACSATPRGLFVSDEGGRAWSGPVSRGEAQRADSPIPYFSIAQGTASGIVDPLEIVIQSGQEWRKLWERHAPSGSAPPPVDFTTQVVVGLFAGQQPTAGYEVQIVKVDHERTRVTVSYQVRSPSKEALVAQVLTQPFHLIRLPRLSLPIQFKRR